MSAWLPIHTSYFKPGQRVAVAISGGADSVALLRALADLREPLGIVLSAVHVHHGLRGQEADGDQVFVAQLSESLGLPLRTFARDTKARASAQAETLEEAARAVRYGCFRELLQAREADVVATAHTLDDQAETVVIKLLRGAWSEGLGGIHPVVASPPGHIFRPMLNITRERVQAYLRSLGQEWREDSSNADPAFTRNRIRHELMPHLAGFNPQIARQLARLAAVARDEEAWWAKELARVLPSLILPGRPTRGGGRIASTHPEEGSLAIELERLRTLDPALRRRVLRAAGAQLGANLGFDQVHALLELVGVATEEGSAPVRPGRAALELPGGLRGERTPRELRLYRAGPISSGTADLPEYAFTAPGRVVATEYGLQIVAEATAQGNGSAAEAELVLRAWRPGDRVQLQYSRGPKKVSDVLDRLRIYGPDRVGWPVVVQGREVLWMRGVTVDPAVGSARHLKIGVIELAGTGAEPQAVTGPDPLP